MNKNNIFILKMACLVALLFIVAGAAIPVLGQDISQGLEAYNRDRIHINKTGMQVLSGWAAANIIGSSYGYFKTGGRTKYFHQMNVAWGVVNLGIGLYALHSIAGQNPSNFSFAESLHEGHNLEHVLLLNIGLDAGYMAFGGFLWERGLRKNSERLRGYGPSLLLQGGFLLLFDSVLYGLNHYNNSLVFDMLNHVTFSGNQLSLHFSL